MHKKIALMALLGILSIASAAPAMAGGGSSPWARLSALLGNQDADDDFKLIHVADLAELESDPNSHVIVLDANVESTREEYGVIPGARLLPSSDNYVVATELPPARNAKLVFYCANRR